MSQPIPEEAKNDQIPRRKPSGIWGVLERTTGFEPATSGDVVARLVNRCDNRRDVSAGDSDGLGVEVNSDLGDSLYCRHLACDGIDATLATDVWDVERCWRSHGARSLSRVVANQRSVRRYPLKLRRRRLLLTTNSEDIPMAAAAIIGLSTPDAASGMAAAL